MNKSQAVAKVAKLRALGTAGRGGTSAERATANRKADQLAARFSISEAEVRARQERPGSGAKVRRPRTRTARSDWIVGVRGAVVSRWEWDPVTGSHSDNVVVHHHDNRGNWKIEIMPEDIMPEGFNDT